MRLRTEVMLALFVVLSRSDSSVWMRGTRVLTVSEDGFEHH
jgi:hypothetical protein